MTFVLSIETKPGHSEQYGFHLGTNEQLARQIVEEKFRFFVQSSLPVVTMALIRDGKLFDCYDGQWMNDR